MTIEKITFGNVWALLSDYRDQVIAVARHRQIGGLDSLVEDFEKQEQSASERLTSLIKDYVAQEREEAFSKGYIKGKDGIT